jgi:hypothetical protein
MQLTSSRVGGTSGATRRMRHGAARTDIEYAWPQLLRPEPAVTIAYLDLNHWIALAKASVGHRDGERSRPALEALRDLRASGDVLLPLSATHYMEVTRIVDPRQRHDIARVMEELSRFACLMDRWVVVRLELQEALCGLLGESARIFDLLPLIGNGALQALGRQGGLRIRDPDGRDVTDETRAQWPGGPAAFDAWCLSAERQLNWSVLAGPDDEEAPALRELGWDPEKATEVTDRRASQESEQATRLAQDPRWRRGRLRDVVAARYLALEIKSALDEQTAQRGVDFPGLFPEPESARQFTDSMPSADVWITLLTALHRNPQTRWTANDIYDADALSVAVPYCDFVATERHATHLLHAADLPMRVDTAVVATLDELVAALTAA